MFRPLTLPYGHGQGLWSFSSPCCLIRGQALGFCQPHSERIEDKTLNKAKVNNFELN